MKTVTPATRHGAEVAYPTSAIHTLDMLAAMKEEAADVAHSR
jgi:hypothetical protein